MIRWIASSFKRQIVFLLFSIILTIGLLVISKIYTDQKTQLETILEQQVAQMARGFSLVVSSDVFYNNYLAVSDDIFDLYQHNQKLANVHGSLFKIVNVAVIDNDNKIVGHSTPSLNPIGTLFDIPTFSSDGEKTGKIVLFWEIETEFLLVTMPILKDSNIIGKVYLTVNPFFLKQSEDKLLNNIIFVVCFFIFILFLTSIVFSRWIDKPFEEIIRQLNFANLGQGKLEFPLVIGRKDEFYTIANALIMADVRILKQKEELLDIQKDLEQRVESRTAEFKNEALKVKKSLEELRLYQQKLIEIEKMASLGSLVAGIAHEINTPVGVSITTVSYIEDETNTIFKLINDENLSKKNLLKYLSSVEKAAKAITFNLNNTAELVRSFKQMAIDQHTEDKRAFNLKEYLDEVLLSLNSRFKNKPISIRNKVDNDIDIVSYAGIFSQILTNFVINSLVHGFNDSTMHGEIMINASFVSDELIFTYEDNGLGINVEHINRIFDPFFTTKLGEGGSGLGLSIIYNLIHHKLNGHIKCENTKQGMMMTITLPKNKLIEK